VIVGGVGGDDETFGAGVDPRGAETLSVAAAL
jgi:hypothetical protein